VVVSNSNAIRIGAFQLDDVANKLVGETEERAISPLACRLLVLLSAHRGEPVARSEIIETLWAGNHLIGENALNRLVSETRKALEDSPQMPRIIQTVPRLGYRLVGAAPTEAPPAHSPSAWFRAGAIWLVVVLVTGFILHHLIDQTIGLIWVLQHP